MKTKKVVSSSPPATDVKVRSGKEFSRLLADQEFDNLTSAEDRMAKTITPDLIAYDPKIFETPVEDGKPLVGRPSTYSNEEKIRACIIHTCTGSVRRTSILTGISQQAIMTWRTQGRWWPVIRMEVEKIRNDLLVAKLDEVIEEATDAMLDRIRNGDEVYNHVTGDKVRVKVKMTDLATGALKVAQEKRNELRGMESMAHTKKDVLEHLSKLASAFEDIAKGLNKKPTEETPIEAEFREI